MAALDFAVAFAWRLLIDAREGIEHPRLLGPIAGALETLALEDADRRHGSLAHCPAPRDAPLCDA